MILKANNCFQPLLHSGKQIRLFQFGFQLAGEGAASSLTGRATKAPNRRENGHLPRPFDAGCAKRSGPCQRPHQREKMPASRASLLNASCATVYHTLLRINQKGATLSPCRDSRPLGGPMWRGLECCDFLLVMSGGVMSRRRGRAWARWRGRRRDGYL